METDQLKRGLKLIKQAKGDVVTALQTNQTLEVGGDALKAFLTILEVAEHATMDRYAEMEGVVESDTPVASEILAGLSVLRLYPKLEIRATQGQVWAAPEAEEVSPEHQNRLGQLGWQFQDGWWCHMTGIIA